MVEQSLIQPHENHTVPLREWPDFKKWEWEGIWQAHAWPL